MSKPTIKVEDLVAEGFKEHPTGRTFSEGVSRFFQRRVMHEGETQFFIDALFYDYTIGDNYQQSWTFQARLYRKDRDLPELESGGFNLELPFNDGHSVIAVVAFFRLAYDALGLAPDPHCR